MSDEEQTRILPETDGTDDKVTKPGVEAIIDRINTLGEELHNDVRHLREEIQAGFGLINRKLQILAGEDLNRRAAIEKLAEQVADLERKAS